MCFDRQVGSLLNKHLNQESCILHKSGSMLSDITWKTWFIDSVRWIIGKADRGPFCLESTYLNSAFALNISLTKPYYTSMIGIIPQSNDNFLFGDHSNIFILSLSKSQSTKYYNDTSGDLIMWHTQLYKYVWVDTPNWRPLLGSWLLFIYQM